MSKTLINMDEYKEYAYINSINTIKGGCSKALVLAETIKGLLEYTDKQEICRSKPKFLVEQLLIQLATVKPAV